MCPPVFIFNNQYVNPNVNHQGNEKIEEVKELLRKVLRKWAENHARIFEVLEEEWLDEEAQLEELLRLKYEAEKLHVLLNNEMKP
ncbi:hypothetical protein [Belliella aquatica]|uniref:Uncharacterized protein n=1 Tax=Belliella aquatica TaxID=1323734 RepID=A0ABQ1MC12_9BACT|nr:hypothetical protein [Belliella aquatica]MCH7406231.1 hypothetical protein [Belliella aquatica]GGC37191.1 hypothetical protein GCM10010993_15030 [Belliella aquatica]